MKILIVHNGYCLSGGEDAVVASEQAALSGRGHKVIVYRRNNAEFVAKPALKKILYLLTGSFFSRDTFRELSALIERERPDMAHVHNIFFMVSASVYAACSKYSVPVVQTLHNYRYICANALLYANGRVCQRCLKLAFLPAMFLRCRNGSCLESTWVWLWITWLRQSGLLNKVARFIALSNFSKSRFVAAGFNESNIVVKPNFVKELPRRKGIGEFVLFAGALADYKGIDDLMLIIERSVGIPFVVAGEGEAEDRLRKWKHSLGSGYSVNIKGPVPFEDLIRLISYASVVIVPSKCPENFPRIIAEAFACAVPVLATDSPVMREIVVNGNGELYGTIDEAVAKLRKMHEDKGFNLVAGEKALQCYREKYTEEENMRILESVYASAMRHA
jgi:glycosyltransferase involved in cell wall biosynthesis